MNEACLPFSGHVTLSLSISLTVHVFWPVSDAPEMEPVERVLHAFFLSFFVNVDDCGGCLEAVSSTHRVAFLKIAQ